ncbi:MAG TPA: hypothetical protein QF417_05685, partial [Acidimicrobiales bacterium]|nr:hypothetical protein [Acidimicrobiales bacterium]
RLSDGGPLFDVRHPFVRRRRRAHSEGGVCEGAGLLPGGAWGGVSTDPGYSEMPVAGGREVVSVLASGLSDGRSWAVMPTAWCPGFGLNER